MTKKMSRKEFIKSAFKALGSLMEGFFPPDRVSSQLLKQRPPGSLPDEKQFLKTCTGCDACMSACPVHVIMIEDLEKRDPIIYPEKSSCIHCPGYPCIAACPTGALDKENGIKLRLI